MKRVIILILICLPFIATSQERMVMSLNSGWVFSKDSAGLGMPRIPINWNPVSLPHTWNDTDVTDDIPGYYRGVGCYKRSLRINPAWRGKSVFLQFEGANQRTRIFINGLKAGEHIGGYTGFAVSIAELLHSEADKENEIVVEVDNSHNEDIAPLSADFTFFGGIYRDVNLIVANPVHFRLEDASSGVYLSTPGVSAEKASMDIKGVLSNTSSSIKKVRVQTSVRDRGGRLVSQVESSVSVKAGEEVAFEQRIRTITRPHLWSPEEPYLYSVVSRIYDAKTHALLDEVTNPLGFRWFKFDPEEGFFLNGKHVKLIGASRHQDFKGMGNALPDSYHYKDVRLLKEMGGNFLRIAHYPQDPAVLEACDKLGILAAIEIPLVNTITESQAFYDNARSMQVEMIRQNYNHPSIIIWAYMNEILLRPKFANDKERQLRYFDNIKKLATELEALTRKEDPFRYTMMSNHGDFNRYKQVGLIDIPMLTGWNLYQGWYGGKATDFAGFLDRHHKEFPEKPLLVTEFGADADPRIRSLNAERFDKSIEYSLNYHQTYLNAIRERPFVAGAMVWNLADFNSESREETMPHINNKGLLTLDRQKKDLYNLYRAYLSKSPIVKISNWSTRAGRPDSLKNYSTQPVSVFSNADSVQLTFNGKLLATEPVEQNEARFEVPFIGGLNVIEAQQQSGALRSTDRLEVDFTLLNTNFGGELATKSLNVLLGSKRYFIDPETQEVWVPDTAYKEGGWGHIGGKAFALPQSNRQGYGTDRNIRNTEADPVYQSQQMGLQKYKLDVPDGVYELSLHFAELISAESKESLAYNLDSSVRNEKAEARIFNVLINGSPYLNNFDIAAQYGRLNAVKKSCKLTVDKGKGIEIVFSAVVGEPVLNALQLRRIH